MAHRGARIYRRGRSAAQQFLVQRHHQHRRPVDLPRPNRDVDRREPQITLRQLTGLMRGEVSVESLPGLGSAFTVRLPLPRA